MEEEIKKHFENLPTPLLVIDENYKIVYINISGKHLLKYSENTPYLTSYVAGRNDVLKILNCFNDITKDKLESSTLEFEIESNGLKSTVNGYFLKCDTVDKTVQLVLTDITEKKTLEQEVRNKGVYLDTVLESLPLGVTIADGQGYIRHVNEKALEISGLKKENILGEFSINLFPNFDDGKRFFENMLGLLEGKTTRVIETYGFNRADGSPVKVELEIMLLEDKQGYISFMRKV
jgi:PAS domain S-box-containing protein